MAKKPLTEAEKKALHEKREAERVAAIAVNKAVEEREKKVTARAYEIMQKSNASAAKKKPSWADCREQAEKEVPAIEMMANADSGLRNAESNATSGEAAEPMGVN